MWFKVFRVLLKPSVLIGFLGFGLIKGVETFTTDIIRHQVTIIGRINPEKVAKRIKKKTGKIADILSLKEYTEGFKNDEDSFLEEMIQKQFIDSLIIEYVGPSEAYLLFSDENANACSIM